MITEFRDLPRSSVVFMYDSMVLYGFSNVLRVLLKSTKFLPNARHYCSKVLHGFPRQANVLNGPSTVHDPLTATIVLRFSTVHRLFFPCPPAENGVG